MSLFLRRNQILRAVAGELAPDDEARLRGHLARCAACRAHYDHLSHTALALGDTTRDRRERARLARAIAGGAPPGRRRVMLLPALLVPATATAALAIWLRGSRDTEPAVGWRGATEEPAVPVRLLVYAIRKGEDGASGPVRLAADFPGAGEGKVSLADYVQFSYRGLATHAYVTVVAVDDGGVIHHYVPRPGGQAVRIPPTTQLRRLGPSIDLSLRHRAGRLRLLALFSREPLPAVQVRQAVSGGTHADAVRVDGILTVEP